HSFLRRGDTWLNTQRTPKCWQICTRANKPCSPSSTRSMIPPSTGVSLQRNGRWPKISCMSPKRASSLPVRYARFWQRLEPAAGAAWTTPPGFKILEHGHAACPFISQQLTNSYEQVIHLLERMSKDDLK